MGLLENTDSIKELVDSLNFRQKVERSLVSIKEVYDKYGDSRIVADSLDKDSVAVWDLARKVTPEIRGFIVTRRFWLKETVGFMKETITRYPELKVYKSDAEVPDKLYETDPDKCCNILKVEPTRRAIEEMGGEVLDCGATLY